MIALVSHRQRLSLSDEMDFKNLVFMRAANEFV